jgi:hypothetical protein
MAICKFIQRDMQIFLSWLLIQYVHIQSFSQRSPFHGRQKTVPLSTLKEKALTIFPITQRSHTPLLNPCGSILRTNRLSPHNGKAISISLISKSLTDVYNIETSWARNFGQIVFSIVFNNTLLPSGTVPYINLDALHRHSITWNDASLTHNDFSQGSNHSLQPALLEALLNDSSTDFLTIASLARSRVRRESDSLTAGSKRALDARESIQAYGKAALILQILGGVAHGTANTSANATTTPADLADLADLAAPKAAVREWLADERLPSGYVRPAKALLYTSTFDLAAMMIGLASKIKGVGSGGAAVAGSASGNSVPAGMRRLFG